jgi:CIC family chloride channel protein
MSALVGAVAGLIAVLFRLFVSGLESARSWASVTIPEEAWWLPLVLAPVGGLLGLSACRLTRTYCPEAGGSGIPHVKATLLGLRRMRPLRLISVKLGAGLLALGAGFSLGREGPTIHLGAACAALIGAWLKLPARSQKSLLAAGAGAGLAAAFNAPLAGFLFIMEELRREMSRLTYGSALVASVTAVAVARLALGQDSSFGLQDGPPIALSALPLVAVVGLASALVGIGFNQMLLTALNLRSRIPDLHDRWGFCLGASGILLICWCPEITGGGHLLTSWLLHGPVTWSHPMAMLGMLLVAKLLYTVACYSSGVPGGIFAPLLSIGAMTGYLLGLAFGHEGASPQWLAVIGMGAVLAASARAPLTGVVLIVEMTGLYHLLYALLLAAFVAYSVAEYLGCPPIYEALLRRDLHGPHGPERQDAQVLEIMVEPQSQFDQVRVAHLPHHDELLIACLEREGVSLIPHGTTVVLAGDLLTLVVGPTMSSVEVADFLDKARTP